MSIQENKMSLSPTLLENSKLMYDNTVWIDWCKWIKIFVEYVTKYLGWEVVRGPGTSLGAIVMAPYYCNYNADGRRFKDGTGLVASYFPGCYLPGAAGWDCDWTQPNGIVDIWQDNHSAYFWGKSGGGRVEQFNDLEYHNTYIGDWDAISKGIDEEHRRFDLIFYVGENEIGQKIGFRIKYPVRSISYAENNELNNTWLPGQNVEFSGEWGRLFSSSYGVYNVPLITLYNSELGDMNGYYYPTPQEQIQFEGYSCAQEFSLGESRVRGKFRPLFSNDNGLIPILFNKEADDIEASGDTTGYYFSDITGRISYNDLYFHGLTTYLYTYMWENQEVEHVRHIISELEPADFNQGIISLYDNNNELLPTSSQYPVQGFYGGKIEGFKNRFFNYHISKNKTTQYLNISDGNYNNLQKYRWDDYSLRFRYEPYARRYRPYALKIITTELENGEKAVLIDTNHGYEYTSDNVALCEFLGVTSGVGNNSNLNLVKVPISPYHTSIDHLNNDYVLQRAVLPGQNSHCIDLYYVSKMPQDIDEERHYVYAKDDTGKWQYFRLVNFGYNTKLAFPVDEVSN